MRNVKVHGIVRNVQKNIEWKKNTSLQLVKSAGNLASLVLPDFWGRGFHFSKEPAKQVNVWNFILDIKDDKFTHSHSLLMVEMSGHNLKGVIREQDEVVVTGKLDVKRNILAAKKVESRRTGEKIIS